jgi:uncharacterized membrane protein
MLALFTTVMANRISALFTSSVLLYVVFSSLHVLETLRLGGFGSVFVRLSMEEFLKMVLSSYLTFVLLFAGVGLALIVLAHRCYYKAAGYGGILLVAFGLITVCYDLSGLLASSILCEFFTSLSVLAAAVATYYSLKAREWRPLLKPFTTRELAVASIFSALTAVLTVGTGSLVPSPTGGYTHIGDSIIFLSGLLFGWRVSASVGVVGSVAADIFLGYPRFYVSIPAHGFEGLVAGFSRDRSLLMKVFLLSFGGFVMATTYFVVNIFIKGYPVAVLSYVRDLFGQAGVSLVLALVLEKIVKTRTTTLS